MKKWWKIFGRYISDDFKRYINEEVLRCNLMMACVKKLDQKCKKMDFPHKELEELRQRLKE